MSACPVCHSSNAPNAIACRACGSSLAKGSTPSAGLSAPEGALAVGSLLHSGGFRIEGVLGQGGFGITYRGQDTGLQRKVAIKEFFPFGAALRIASDNRLEPTGGLSRAEFEKMRAQFFEEARTLARFNHPGIVNVYTVFQEKNTAYMVMEFLRGKSLMQLVETRGKIPESEAIELIEKAGHALEEVHRVGLLHRDLKPDNVMLCDGRVVLLDFGSAFAIAQDSAQAQALVTPGYAPLEQYSTTARFAAYTDIYSLGATLYCLLTGAPPPEATDRAAGVELKAPQASRLVSDAVIWALQTNAGQRPQTVREWLRALRSTKDSSRDAGKGSTPFAPSPAPKTADPRAPRIQKILQELDAPLNFPVSSHDARLGQIQALLSQVANFAPQPNDSCPACQTRSLRHMAPSVGASQCPLCDGPLNHRQLSPARCAVCRADGVQEYSFAGQKMFCPLCRVAPLREDKRKKFAGLAVDLWLNCPNCKAQWDEFSNGTARLIHADEALAMSGDTRQRAEEYLNQTKPLSEWKTLADRGERVLRCASCNAQWDVLPDGRDKLVRWPRDPHGVGKQFGDKALFRRAWTRIGYELPLAAGNCNCLKCSAEWNWDATAQTLQLLKSEDRFLHLKNKTQSISVWRFEVAGKTSMRAGHLCGNCKSEWDDENDAMKLVRAGRDALIARVGERRSFADWQRISRGLPDSQIEAGLRQESARLQNAKTNEQQSQREMHQHRNKALEKELDGLLRQSVLHGFIPAPGLRSRTLKKEEEARWMGPAVLLKYRTLQGAAYWDTERQATLLVSDRRIIFEDAPGIVGWERPLEKLSAVEAHNVSGQPLLHLQFQGLKNPVGFLVIETTLDVVVENRTRRLVFNVVDLAAWLQSIL